MTDLTWQQKAAALNALARLSIHIRDIGNWYAHCEHVDIKKGSILSSCTGNGTNPEGAINDYFRRLTTIIDDEYIVIDAMDEKRRHAVKWNGFMWQQVIEES